MDIPKTAKNKVIMYRMTNSFLWKLRCAFDRWTDLTQLSKSISFLPQKKPIVIRSEAFLTLLVTHHLDLILVSAMFLITLILYLRNLTKTNKPQNQDNVTPGEVNDDSGLSATATFSINSVYQYLRFNTKYRQTIQKLFDVEPEIGGSFLEPLPNDFRNEVQENFQRVLGGEHLPITKKLGDNYFYLMCTPSYFQNGKVNGLTCSLVDITQKMEAEQQLEEYHEKLENIVEERTKELILQRDFFQKIIDANSNLIFVRNKDGKYIMVNKTAADSFAPKFDNVIGKTVLETHSNQEEARVFLQEDQDILKKGSQFISESVFENHEGIQKSLYLVKRRIEVKGEHFVLGVHTDVTEIKKQGERLKKANKELNNALEKLKKAQKKLIESEKLASLGALTAGLAHEINNPINYVSGNVSPLLQDFEDIEKVMEIASELRDELQETTKGEAFFKAMDELEIDVVMYEIRNLLAGISDGTDRVKELMKNLKNLSRQNENLPIKIDINKIIKSTLALVRPSIHEDISIRQDLKALPKIKGQPGELSQVLLNIIDNAIFAMNKRGKLKVSSEVKDEEIHIWIADSGKGIPEDQLEEIFEPFFTTKDVGEGTGLGLAISRQIISRHRGHILVESEVGKGRLFTLAYPSSKIQVRRRSSRHNRMYGLHWGL